ncbi:hypothetical protein AUC71_07130 [Methyloceanibacter marginalis]|uniref:Uncharacterized protein n=1 Tax=Methyloceanibacter marginalis TaxID=1774971 RepID=A0A1E3WDS1_9HYPH|nr:hypothetical protein [Methyloceanibacter marginalis]ODS03900.1 hypothetical protein AUC71_07130 [Methyloceanibacter marginalis]
MRASVLIAVCYVLVQALSLTGPVAARAETASANGLLPWERAAPATDTKPDGKSDEAPAAEKASVEPDATPAALGSS